MNRREMLKAAAVVAGGVCLPKDVTAKTLQEPNEGKGGYEDLSFSGYGHILFGSCRIMGVSIWCRDLGIYTRNDNLGCGPGAWMLIVRHIPGAVLFCDWDKKRRCGRGHVGFDGIDMAIAAQAAHSADPDDRPAILIAGDGFKRCLLTKVSFNGDRLAIEPLPGYFKDETRTGSPMSIQMINCHEITPPWKG